LNKPLIQKRPEVSLSAFSFLFSEIVQQIMKTEKATQAQK
jgi:trafficking protein particle complex subunit 5